jgi:O-antigen ligase
MDLSLTMQQPKGEVQCLSGALALALLILSLPAHDVGTLALLLLGATVAWFAPAVMVATVILTIPIQDVVHLPIFVGQLTITQIALIGLAIGWGVACWRRTIWLDAVLWWFVAILGALLLSLIAVDEIGNWTGEVYRWGAAAAFYLIARSVVTDWPSMRMALWSMVVAVCAISSYGFGQVMAENGPDSFIRGGILRVYGAFGQPNPFAAYMEFIVPLLLAMALIGLRADYRRQLGTALWIGTVIATTLGFAIVMLTQSRGGWLGLGTAMLAVLCVFPVRLRLLAVGAGAVLLGLILLTPPGQSQIDRYQSSFDTDEPFLAALVDIASTGREGLWGAAIGMLADEPVTGMGAGEFDYHYRQYTTDWYQRVPLGQAHNGYLHMAAQAGIPGVATFLGWLLAMVISLMAAVKHASEPVSRALALGALAVVVAFAVHSVVDYLNVLSLGLQLSAVVAIGLNLVTRRVTVPEPQPHDQPMTTSMPLQAGNA